MHQLLGDFIHALRQADIPISTAETLDAIRTAQLLGLEQRPQLKLALGLVLAKSEAHKHSYDIVFEHFFSAQTAMSHDTAVEADNSDSTVSVVEAGEAETVDESSVEAQALAEQLQSPLALQLMAGEGSQMASAIAEAGQSENVNQIQFFTQKGRYRYRIMQQLGVEALNQELLQLETQQSLPARQVLQQLEQRKLRLSEQVGDYVEQQYLLYAEQKNQRQFDQNLSQIKLSHIDTHHYQRMSRLVRKAAKQLASQHGRRRKQSKRGMLDVRKTIAANAAFDGIQFRTRWRATRIERPKVMAICDVSGSVSRMARFLLLFLYCLQDVLPKVRSFVFASNMGEVTQSFAKQDLEDALAEIMNEWANQPTDYGRALVDFSGLALDQIDRHTTVIMLGDARNNNAPAEAQVWEQVYRRSKRVLWLNPESRNSWNTGDSVMASYAPYCSQVEVCQSLRDLQRILGGLLKLN
ncbi:VWA domain-containing protein [Pseudomaricurvus alkylphenolicus]|uniref:VWA domain-containing protein n=1 Tax=Pseudomaricurvus alkylphenolicus TaxID=1306991 RepID=UPI00141DB301|nr:VWA domain-containing protein [Pseudomaricurvus alkylphenolicus]NIB44663.1 VWA domain-containing protein [Pseudomaricurvus alkylphenolicus]